MTSAPEAPAPSVAMETVARQSMVVMTTIIWLHFVSAGWRLPTADRVVAINGGTPRRACWSCFVADAPPLYVAEDT